MCESTNFIINLNNNEDAIKAAAIVTEIASQRDPEYPNEINQFLEGLNVEGSTVKVEENYSLYSNTFCELIPQIMLTIARYNFGAITMEAWFTSYSCGYEAEIMGRVFKNGKFKMTLNEKE